MCDMCVKSGQVLELAMSKADQSPADALSLLARAITSLTETSGNPWSELGEE